jgi:hypothetical protein
MTVSSPFAHENQALLTTALPPLCHRFATAFATALPPRLPPLCHRFCLYGYKSLYLSITDLFFIISFLGGRNDVN